VFGGRKKRFLSLSAVVIPLLGWFERLSGLRVIIIMPRGWGGAFALSRGGGEGGVSCLDLSPVSPLGRWLAIRLCTIDSSTDTPEACGFGPFVWVDG
jgi:hypothetical protein